MPRYRKKPVVIEAFEFTGFDQTFPDDERDADVPGWWFAAIKRGLVTVFTDFALIETLEGAHRAELGDYIIQGVAGELYPCKPAIFAATYEAAD